MTQSVNIKQIVKRKKLKITGDNSRVLMRPLVPSKSLQKRSRRCLK